MSLGRERARIFEPREPGPNEVHETILGLASLAARLDSLLEPDRGSALVTDGPSPAASEVELALLGLFSLRTTFGLTLDALLDDRDDGADDRRDGGSSWDREHLR